MSTIELTAEPLRARAVWPLFGLRLTSGCLELRPVGDDDLDSLAELARKGIHDPAWSPFSNPWADRTGLEFERGFAQYFWSQRARWTVDAWTLPFAVRVDGELAGVQQLDGRDFPLLRTVGSSSWLGRGYQGRGIGTEMRAAVLAFAFGCLAAEVAATGAYDYNVPSIRVSEKLGYARNGVRRDIVRGRPVTEILFRLERDAWRGSGVEVEGLDACAHLFGLTPERSSPEGEPRS